MLLNRDENGDFSYSFLNCPGLNSVNVIGYDPVNNKQSQPVAAAISNNSANTGVITVCDIVDEFFNITLDGQTINYAVNIDYNRTLGTTLCTVKAKGPNDSLNIYLEMLLGANDGTVNKLNGGVRNTTTHQVDFFGCQYCASPACGCAPADSGPGSLHQFPIFALIPGTVCRRFCIRAGKKRRKYGSFQHIFQGKNAIIPV